MGRKGQVIRLVAVQTVGSSEAAFFVHMKPEKLLFAKQNSRYMLTFFFVVSLQMTLGARTLLGAPGITTRKKKLLGAPGIATRSSLLMLAFQGPGLDHIGFQFPSDRPADFELTRHLCVWSTPTAAMCALVGHQMGSFMLFSQKTKSS